MSNYSKTTDFASKDALTTGNANKIVKGTEIDDEFDAIQVAIATKANLNSPTLTGTPLAPTAAADTNTTQIATTAFITAAITTAVTAAKLALYPVGSIYTNASVATNPATLLGFGTWVAFGAGKVAVGFDAGDTSFDTLEETGGSKDAINVSHTHTIQSGGEHTHTIPHNSDSATVGDYISGNDGPNNTSGTASPTASSGSHTHTATASGSSGTDANLQPYITVHMWKRTA